MKNVPARTRVVGDSTRAILLNSACPALSLYTTATNRQAWPSKLVRRTYACSGLAASQSESV